MDDNREHHFNPQNPDPQKSQSPPRRFVYRSVEREAQGVHPLRRSTDTPHQFQAIAAQLCPNPLLLQFRVYLKVN
jgi:hypothetical protein